MKTGALNSITSGLAILSFSLLLIMSFSVEALATRGCTSFGHSCFGGHGKRSSGDDVPRMTEVGMDAPSTNEISRRSSINDVLVNLSTNDIQQLRDFMKCRNCVVESSRRARDNKDSIPLLLRQLIVSIRHPYNSALTPNNE